MTTRARVKVNLGVVRDWNVAQGISHPTDLSYQIPRDINIRRVSIENSSPYTAVGIAIMDSFELVPNLPLNFILRPGEIRHIGINTIGEPIQYIHIMDINTKKHLGEASPLQTITNQFVLREGINKWFVSRYHQPNYSASK